MANYLMWGIYFSSLYLAIFWLLVLINKYLSRREVERIEFEPSVSVIVPAFNEEEHVKECIESLLSLEYPRDKLEVIVVNDGSSDDTGNICKSFGRKIKFIDLKKNSGTKAVPLNIGLREATGEIVACLDADSIVLKDNLKKMMPFFDAEDVGAVTPALKVFEPKTILQKLQWYEYLFAILLRKLMSLIDCIYVTPGPFSLYRRKVVEELGGFSEDNITEDMEMALRLQANHFKIRNAMDAYVYTHAPDNLSKLYSQRRRWYQGLLINSRLYRRIFFNREYGDFSILMPLNVASVIILMLSTLLFFYYLFKPIIKFVVKLFLIDFDLTVYFRNLEFTLFMLDFNYNKIFVLLAVFMFGLLSLYLSHRFSREKIRRYGIRPVIAFSMLYFLFLGTLWLGVVSEWVRGSKIKW
ncbi:MAG: glycosyltransferase family 2 protein [Methanobacteriota archaeon]